MKTKNKLQVVVETTEYLKQAELYRGKKSREGFVSHIARNPLEQKIG